LHRDNRANMGRCNGGGGRRNGGGGWQEGQNIGKKSGKTGHGKSGQHDATTTQREVQKRDKNGQPLNFGPFRNGYYVGKEKPAASAERVGLASDQMQELSTLLTQSSLSSPAVASDEATASSSGSGTYQAPRRSQLRCADAGGGESKMTASQQRESERLLREHEALLTSDTHKRLRAIRSALPAFDSRAAVLAAIASEQVLIICGETGCGKSTQVPQYVLEASIEAGVGAKCTVLIAQPRRVAAVSLAERVATERGEALGETVGYSIRHEAVASGTTTRLLFCTTGVIRALPCLEPTRHLGTPLGCGA
jgi:HrpA-like RNA helicase